jgi:hypothetical protein
MSDLAELLIKDLSETMRTTLAPFIERMEHTDKQYKTLVTIMNSMPEFQRIMDENNLLKEELRRQTESILAAPTLSAPTLAPPTLAPPTLAPPTLAPPTIIEPSIPVRLEITSLTDSIVNAFDVTEHVKEIYDTFNTEDVVSAEEVADEEVANEVDASEVDASEADASEADASEADASEADEEEEEASEAAVEESDEDEEEAACVAVEEEEASEAEASEAEASEADEEEAACVAVEEEADEEEEVFIVEIDDVEYYTSDDVNGVIYSVDANEEVGEKVGQFIDGEPTFI